MKHQIASHFYQPLFKQKKREPFREVKSPNNKGGRFNRSQGKHNTVNATYYDMIIDENDHLLLN